MISDKKPNLSVLNLRPSLVINKHELSEGESKDYYFQIMKWYQQQHRLSDILNILLKYAKLLTILIIFIIIRPLQLKTENYQIRFGQTAKKRKSKHGLYNRD
ncbi:Hypothetical_protein [Hexamita inflata]|uniref:Hypothetical_protein n=1 Tax=Hexamita inflata TaxID=28002 RepID=A0AA86R0T5_9EUKA|nr:Hypothetical protein HINF_LOCUS51847 [Hexamita inflata]